MTLTTRTLHGNHFLTFVVTGSGAPADFALLIARINDEAGEARVKRVLVDLRGVAESLKFTDEFTIGEMVASLSVDLEMIASLVPAGRRTGTSEKVAKARHAPLRVFEDEAQAIAWLEAGAPMAGSPGQR